MHWTTDPRKCRWCAWSPEAKESQVNFLPEYEGDDRTWQDRVELYASQGLIVGQGVGITIPTEFKHLRVNYPWYEDQKARWDPVTVAQEVDIDYHASVEGVVIPQRWVMAAVAFYEKMVGNQTAGERISGYDVAAEGSNKNVIITRDGIKVISVYAWNKTDTYVSAEKSAAHIQSMRSSKCNLDGDGIGTSIAGSWKNYRGRLGFKFVGVRGGWSPTVTRWPNGRTSKQMFHNLRAEMYWILRTRFEKTYEHMELDVPHDIEDLIAIPREQSLITDLPKLRQEKMPNGKIKIESKKDMVERGVKSPDYADALALCFAPDVVEPLDDKGGATMETM
jgi:hypothetical protein